MQRWLSLTTLAGLLLAAGCSAHGASTPPLASGTTATTATARMTESVVPRARLATYRINKARVYVSGISSGGFFAVQMHVAHSATFKGAAIYAGGVFYCALGNVGTALGACGGEGLYASTLTESEAYLDAMSAAGTIDSEKNLAGQPVYLWAGKNDTVVAPAEMNDLAAEYVHYGSYVIYDNQFSAEHGWESPNGELACGTLGEPYIVNCSLNGRPYDSEQTWLKLLYGQLHDRNNGKLEGSLINFDQTEFGATASNSMDTNGYVFVPKPCAQGQTCSLVVAFHGCLQTQSDIGTKFPIEGGIDPWADHNNIIVLYPYAIKSSPNPENPKGCWDWWGYDDPQYALKAGTQVSIIYRMVQRLMGT